MALRTERRLRRRDGEEREAALRHLHRSEVSDTRTTPRVVATRPRAPASGRPRVLGEALVEPIDQRGRRFELADDDAHADLAEVVRLHAERLPDSRDHVGGGNAAIAV